MLHKKGPAPQSRAAKNQTVRTNSIDARTDTNHATKEGPFAITGPTLPFPHHAAGGDEGEGKRQTGAPGDGWSERIDGTTTTWLLKPSKENT